MTKRPLVCPFQVAAPAAVRAGGAPAGVAGLSCVHATFGAHRAPGVAGAGHVTTPFQRSFFKPSEPVGPFVLRPPNTYKVLGFPLKSVVAMAVIPLRNPMEGVAAAAGQFVSVHENNSFVGAMVLGVKKLGISAQRRPAFTALLCSVTS